MPRAFRTRRYRQWLGWTLVGSIAAAAVLRFVGLDFGRGVLMARVDEELLRSGVLISLAGDLNPHYAVWGHLFHYIYTLVAAAWIWFQVWAGQVRSWTDGVAAAHCEPWTVIWIGRAISAAAGVLTLPATYQLARRSLGSRSLAVWSCVLLSTMFLHVRDSHFATSDVMLGLFCTAALAAMTGRRLPRPGWAGLWTGLALATKLLSVTVVIAFFCLLILSRRRDGGGSDWLVRFKRAAIFFFVAASVALVTQPFLILDPMETWFGLFGDLFNRERRPFEHGLSVTNASIIARYYVPQAMGWPLGIAAVLGGCSLLRRIRSPRVIPILAFAFWSLAALLSVERIFLRYLDPALPAVCVLAAQGAGWLVRNLFRVMGKKSTRNSATAALIAIAALPNLWRSIWLDYRLKQPDTRALAADWIVEHVPPESRVLWSGYGKFPPEVTMPWLHAPREHDREHATLRESRGLETSVDDAIFDWKQARDVPTYSLVGLTWGELPVEKTAFDAYPFLEHHFEIGWLERVDAWSRGHGFLRRESPRMDLMRRHVTGVLVTNPDLLPQRDESIVVLTGMPCDPAVVARLREWCDEIQRFEPEVDWTEYAGRVMYDMGDRWYLPNWGLERVVRPGPEIRIYRRRPADTEPRSSARQSSDE